jgi:hypothetical protein
LASQESPPIDLDGKLLKVFGDNVMCVIGDMGVEAIKTNCNFVDVSNFQLDEGYFMVNFENGKNGLIKRNGDLVELLQFSAFSFENGILILYPKYDSKAYFFDTIKNEIVPCIDENNAKNPKTNALRRSDRHIEYKQSDNLLVFDINNCYYNFNIVDSKFFEFCDSDKSFYRVLDYDHNLGLKVYLESLRKSQGRYFVHSNKSHKDFVIDINGKVLADFSKYDYRLSSLNKNWLFVSDKKASRLVGYYNINSRQFFELIGNFKVTKQLI